MWLELCHCELEVPVKGIEGKTRDGGSFCSLVDQCFTILYPKKIEIALFPLICRVDMVGKQDSQDRVICDP